jgi:hypothetical protein
MPKTPIITSRAREPRARHKKHKNGRFFRGIRTETQTEKTIVTGDGRRLDVRVNGSKYPKSTTITLCESTRRIYSLLRNSAKYHNYNELLLDIAEKAIKAEIFPLNERALEALESYLLIAKFDRTLMEDARKKADEKRRYYRRETSMRHEVRSRLKY